VTAPTSHPRDATAIAALLVSGAVAWAATTLTIKASALNRINPEKALLYRLVVSAPLLAAGAVMVFSTNP
jgi:hypothetical protein